jgi:hypothetical protein
MTQGEALVMVRALAAGLESTDAGSIRLLERISVHPEAEALRSALMEAGARATLDIGKQPAAFNPPRVRP